MATITINEISENYTYNIGTNSFATVALPITAAWGPAYMDPDSVYGDSTDESSIDLMLENTNWNHFPATQEGLEAFVATYRGPESNYRLSGDYSYQMAMTLLTAGYDVLVCRVCPGAKAAGSLTIGGKALTINAKYPGTFGNNLKVVLNKIETDSTTHNGYWSLVTYVVDASGSQSAVENLYFVFDIANADTIPYIGEVQSNFLELIPASGISDTTQTEPISTTLAGGTDILNSTSGTYGSTYTDSAATDWYAVVNVKPDNWKGTGFVYTPYYSGAESEGVWTFTQLTSETAPDWGDATVYIKLSTIDAAYNKPTGAIIYDAEALAKIRYGVTATTPTPDGFKQGVTYTRSSTDYTTAWKTSAVTDATKLGALYHNEWVYNAAFLVYQLLKDKLNYAPQRIISPGWDDQNISEITGGVKKFDKITPVHELSPFHEIIMEVAYYGRCATGMIDVPKSLARSLVWNDDVSNPGYAQMLARIAPAAGDTDINAKLYVTHSAFFAPWGQYRFVGMNKLSTAPGSFLELLIHRAQILNQAVQYEWVLPSNRAHNLNIGPLDYKVPNKLLNEWQTTTGVGVNVITTIPGLGTNVWGNSTLFEVPPATYQALANLSTRWLVNAVENVAYNCGISITFQYNNDQAYNKFYAGVTPILDTMKSVGAIDDYKVKMSADINGLDQVNANTVIGKIYLVINGVVNDIVIDLIALPPGTDLNQFA